MAKILDTNDLLEVCLLENIPEADPEVQAVIDAVDALAAKIATHFGIEKGETTSEGKAFGGLCASFYPKTADQECPKMIDEGDEGGDWEPRNQEEVSSE